jgi:hypothetical protein
MAEQLTPLAVLNRLVVQPSDMLTAVPPFVFAVPNGWTLDEAPARWQWCACRRVDGFWVNAMLNARQGGAQRRLKVAAQITWAKLQRTTTDLTERGEKLMRFGICRCTSVAPSSPAPRAGAWRSCRRCGSHQSPKAAWSTFQLVLTCPVEHMAACTPPIMEMLSTFRFV